jgi:Flp pilus assembly protein TadG
MKNSHRHGRRRGIEAVEVAMTMPLLVLTMFASIEMTHRWHLENMLKLTAAEALKAGAARGGDSGDAQAVFDAHIAALGIAEATLTFSEDFDNPTPGHQVSVAATANWAANRTFLPAAVFWSSGTMSSGVITYRREGL